VVIERLVRNIQVQMEEQQGAAALPEEEVDEGQGGCLAEQRKG
jgi:hypothetical protein